MMLTFSSCRITDNWLRFGIVNHCMPCNLFHTGTNDPPEWVAEESELFKTQLDKDGNGKLQGSELFEWVRPDYTATATFDVIMLATCILCPNKIKSNTSSYSFRLKNNLCFREEITFMIDKTSDF